MDITVQLRGENERLKRAVDELSILNELATAIGGVFDSQKVIRKIISRSLKAVDAEQGVITMVDETPNQPMRTLVRTNVSSSDHEEYHLNQALLGWMILNKKPLVVNDPASDQRLHGVHLDCSVHSVLCVPMLVHSNLKGVLSVYNKKNGRAFTEDDQRLLAIIAAQSVQVIENVRLYEEEQSLLKIQEELKLASQIQNDLLPKETPKLCGYEVAGATFPAREVGGDYFDFIPLNSDKIAVCLGDVSGKGLTAALLMANLQASLRNQTYIGNPVQECICKINRHLYQSTSPEKFATLFYGILDIRNHSFTYCNAGHEPPILIGQGEELKRLKEGGTVVGIMEGFNFQETVVEFQPGDALVAFSDGVTEAMNQDREQFGEIKLTNLLREHVRNSANEMVQEIVRSVKAHAGSTPQYDDITALVVKRNLA